MERRFQLIDGNITKHTKICAYCTYHHGFLTERLLRLHGCKCKKDGSKCPCLEVLFYVDGDKK